MDGDAPPFPPGADAPLPADLPEGIGLRRAGSDDMALVRALHVDTAVETMADLPWTPAQRRAVADDQFHLQHIHFVRHYPQADFWIVTRAGHPIGRLYLDRAAGEWRLIDILLAAEARGAGTGSALMGWIQRAAAAAGVALALQVAVTNPRAHALYVRLGFRDAEGAGETHQLMRWR